MSQAFYGFIPVGFELLLLPDVLPTTDAMRADLQVTFDRKR